MEKYWLIIVLFVPLALYGIVRAVTLFKLGKITKQKMFFKLLGWSSLLIVSVLAQGIIELAIKLKVTGNDYMTIYDIILAFVLILSLMINVKLVIQVRHLGERLNKLLSLYSIERSKD